jgi:hypothetical protein
MIKTLLKILSKEQFGFIDSNDLTVLEGRNYPLEVRKAIQELRA